MSEAARIEKKLINLNKNLKNKSREERKAACNEMIRKVLKPYYDSDEHKERLQEIEKNV